MEIEKLMPIAVAAALAAAAAGQLPEFIREVRIAQLDLLRQSESHKWGRPFMLPVKPRRGLHLVRRSSASPVYF